ncbi:hypothetical protein SAMN05428965_0004 [Geodermatophilus sp. DSM 45219]|nr:hypothetical protein SAMN05428965_0004 [Geodermatophilus sp. DSM 45219]
MTHARSGILSCTSAAAAGEVARPVAIEPVSR